MGKRVFLEGQNFGRLKVINDIHVDGLKSYVIAICQCGIKRKYSSRDLISGDTKSCGCLSREKKLINTKTHGHSINRRQSKTLASYWAMMNRCLNKNYISYPRYGGDNVIICKRWMECFENFLEDMGERPKGKTLDRIKNPSTGEPYKIYSKKTCRWSTPSEQNLNKRPYGKIKIRGVSQRGKSFRAHISFQGKTHQIGTFKTKELAGLAYEACKEVLLTSIPN